MKRIFRFSNRRARHAVWLLLAPALTFCADRATTESGAVPGDSTAARPVDRPSAALAAATTAPGTVTNLSASATNTTTVTLTFTQVDDGAGAPAKYDVRYSVAPLTWGSAASVTNGTCRTPLAGTAIGSPMTCTVTGLTAQRSYAFQLVSFRGTMNQGATYGALSNVATATTPATAPTVSTVTVSPASASIPVGGTQQLNATAKDAGGNTISCSPYAWTSSNTSAATVSSTGLASGVAAGSATMTATCSGKSGTSAITVTSTPTVNSVAVSPSSASIQVGATQQLSATAKDASGNAISCSPYAWTSSNASVATVSSAGLARGVAAGSATITTACSGKSATSAITVTSGATTNPGTVNNLAASATSGNSVTLTFTQVTDGTGQPAKYDVRYSVAPISWGGAASVTNGTCATPLAGTTVGATMTCTVNGLSASTNYNFQLIAFRGTMNQGAVYGAVSNVAAATTPATSSTVASVTVTPASASIAVGGTQQLTASARDANGAAVSCSPFTWSSSSSSVAAVSSSGLVTGAAAGTATISAACGGRTGTSSITVTSTAPTVNSVTVSPTSASIQTGGTQQLAATARTASGTTISCSPYTWTSSNNLVAAVSSNGLVSGASAGSATITATCSGKSGTSMVTVTAPPPPPPGSGTLLFSENFENTSMSSRGWYDNTSPALSTAEHIAGSASSLQFHWTAGATNPQNGGAMRHKFTAGNSFYLSYYVKYSANYVGSGQDYHPHEFHALSNLDDDWTGPADTYMTLYIEQNYQNGGRPKLAIQDNKSINTSYGSLPRNLIGVTENRSVSGCNGVSETNVQTECFAFSTSSGYYNLKGLMGPVTFNNTPGSAGYKNSWNYVEAYFQMNTIVNGVSQANGVMQYWFNGQLVIDRHDIVFRTAARANLMFDKFVIAPYIGDGSPVDQYMWIDNLRVATARIP